MDTPTSARGIDVGAFTRNTNDGTFSKDLTFARLSDLKVPVEIKVSNLEGKIKRKTLSETLANPATRHAQMQTDGVSDLFVTIQLYSKGRALTLPFQTGTKAFKPDRYVWNSTIQLPILYASLPQDAQLAITLWDIEAPGKAAPVGGSTLELFNKKGTLKRGQQRCYLHPRVKADPTAESVTPSDVFQDDELGRLLRLVKDYERGDMARVEWLDVLVFRQIEKIQAREVERTDKLFLYIDLPRFDFPVVFAEQEANLPLPPQPIPNLLGAPVPSPLPPNFLASDPHLWRIYDPETVRVRADGEGNPVEAKYRRLARSHRTGRGDRELKPGPEMRDLLNDLFRQPPTYDLSPEDKDIIWRYRFSLHTFKRSLTKFLKSVTWSDAAEARQAVEVLLPLWTEVGMDDALELLGPGFEDGRVRAFAVKQLARADDEELQLYLLQLVQALKFEVKSTQLRKTVDQRAKPQRSRNSSNTSMKTSKAVSEEDSGLADFLIERAARNAVLGTVFHWYLMVECEDKVIGKMYARVAFQFMQKLVGLENGSDRRDTLKRQGEMIALLSTKAKELRASKDPRPKKIDKLRTYIADSKHGLSTLQAPLTLPLNPRVQVTGIDASRSSVFKSNLLPMLLWFETEDSDYPIIFKNGDDLRQDQLVIQLFTLMDRLLRRENLDLKLSPYAVLATGQTEGMVQFVPSKSLAAIMGEYGSLLNYLKVDHANEGAIGTLGVEPAVLDTFIRSCAGYSVITYILGVGDRHLDNLMLSPDVDFGYILGRDPKPFPPPVKVCREMVDAMGGPQSPHYNRFKSLCYTAFIGLRKNANLILNLIALMVDANIQDIRLEPDKAVLKVQEKFMLDIPEEDAIKHLEVLLNDTSYLTLMFDKVHTLAQYLRE
ncbi:hypothetical protein QFC20_007629 [Naganishia adeliensis]|uniref:Uncharacterized protein n=1 Tax=Naganishia adeliensis TaxID=92952 RepID=A0ACC2UXI4_9TREE|nr:hypothetical protein QFC20_007629 [Naganishia adeliensis]